MQTIEITDIELAMSLPNVLAECLSFVTQSRAAAARITPAARNHGVLEWHITLTGTGAYRYVQPRPVDKGRIVHA